MIAKLLRGVTRVVRATSSNARRLYFNSAFPRCHIAKGVLIESGVVIRVTDGATIEIAAGCSIGRGTQLIAKGGALVIGESTFVGPQCSIVANRAISIGRDGLIAEGVTIRDQDHGMKAGGEVPFSGQPISMAAIEIGPNCWVGAKSTVLKGVTIGPDSVIAANCVVNRDVAEGSLVGGVPCRLLRSLYSAGRKSDGSGGQ